MGMQKIEVEITSADTAYSVSTMLHALQGSMATLRAYRDCEALPITPDQILAQLELIELGLVHTLNQVD